MITQKYSYDEQDFSAYYLCKAIGSFSTCGHKKVGTVLFDELNRVVGVGYNRVYDCNHLCNKTCGVRHSEIVALDNVARSPTLAYLNLFPCIACQRALSAAGVELVKVFGAQGNKPYDKLANLKIQLIPDLPKKLVEYNGALASRQVVQGECAELITAISDLDSRKDRTETLPERIDHVFEEAIDVKLQLQVLDVTLDYTHFFSVELAKWNKLLAKFRYIFFPDKDL